MINTLRISRFKSIKELSLNCKRFNIFIGEPNTGKSNILESLGMFSFLAYSEFGYAAKQAARFERTSNLFYDEVLEEPLRIQCDAALLTLGYTSGRFSGEWREADGRVRFGGDYNDLGVQSRGGGLGSLLQFKFYRFVVRETFPRLESEFLIPPSGSNLLSLLLSQRELRSVVNQPFLDRGLRLSFRPQENKIEVAKQVDDVIISYPYSLTSETFQRLTFHIAAILSNRDSVLVFEEPESHSFPYHTKYLAEQIALDENNNQYFIATHNPYFLLPLLEKSSTDEVAVFIVYYEDYETKVKELAPEALTELAEIDIFSNLERYLEV